MKRSEAGAISNRSCLESDVSMLDIPALEGTPRIPVDTSDSQRRGVGSSQSLFSNELDRIREESRQPFVPFRKDRRKLKVELPNFWPILPPIAKPRRTFVQIPNSTRVKGDHFHVNPGLIDTDSVKDPGVGARMIYATVPSQDEQEFFGVWPNVANTPEQKIIEVSHLHHVCPISNTILITLF